MSGQEPEYEYHGILNERKRNPWVAVGASGPRRVGRLSMPRCLVHIEALPALQARWPPRECSSLGSWPSSRCLVGLARQPSTVCGPARTSASRPAAPRLALFLLPRTPQLQCSDALACDLCAGQLKALAVHDEVAPSGAGGRPSSSAAPLPALALPHAGLSADGWGSRERRCAVEDWERR